MSPLYAPFRAARHAVCARALALASLVLLCVLLAPPAHGRSAAAAGDDGWVLVRVPFPGPDAVTSWLERGWDVWSVHPARGVVLQLPPDEARTLVVRDGAQVLSAQQSPTVQWYSCYYSYGEARAALQDLASRKPELVELVNIGPSWETENTRGVQRQLWSVRLTNRAVGGSKPRLVVLGLHHAREAVTPALALAMAERLVDEHGVDPTLTWMLDTTEVWVVPVVNPDGLMKAEARLDWRKNHNHDACGDRPVRQGSGPGVDLNRNYGYYWGGRGASPDACDELYRGAEAFSEPEARNVRDLLRDVGPDLVVTLHSYSELVLYPFGYTRAAAPDEEGLSAVARALASHAGYRPIPTHELYLASGDTCDWAYGSLGAPCVTFEVGSASENYFWPDCRALQAQVDANVPALIHAARIAPKPYALSLGPLAGPVTVRALSDRLALSARLDDTHSGSQAIRSAELWIGTPGDYGAGIPMDVRGSGDGLATASVEIDRTLLAAGRQWLLVRGRDVEGHWGPVGAAWFDGAAGVETPTAQPPTSTASATRAPATGLPPVAPSPTATPTPTPTRTAEPSATPLPEDTLPPPAESRTATAPAVPTRDAEWRTFLPLVLRIVTGRSSVAASDG